MKIFHLSIFIGLISQLLGRNSDKSMEALKKLGDKSFLTQHWGQAGDQEMGTMIYDFVQRNAPITN